MLQRICLGAGLALLVSLPVAAGEGGDLLRQHLYAGTIAQGITALEPLAAEDKEAQFALGTLQFFGGIEHLAQALYRHGLVAPDAGALGPALPVPVPVNADPEPLDYEGFREILETLVSDLDTARATLIAAGEAGDYVVPLDPMLFRIDIDGDGQGSENESIAGVLQHQWGIDPSAAPAEPDSRRSIDKNIPAAPDLSFGFDRADAIWLAGYSQIIASQADFLLSHDFSDLTGVAFHRFFPRAGFPMQKFTRGFGPLVMDPENDAAIADIVAAVHNINWPVSDAERLRGVRERLRSMTALSRANWQAILAETDNEREFLPSPTQNSPVPDAVVTDEIVAAWHDTLDQVDRILEGDLLVPHWRFEQGFDLKAYFETAERTDFVMILTGFGALPYLKDGPKASLGTFSAAGRVLGDNWLGYAFWFN